MLKKIYNLVSFIDNKFYFKIISLILLMVFCAFMEIISLGAIMPFIFVITDPDKLFQYKAFQFLKNFNEIQLILTLLSIFTVIIIISAVSRVILLWKTSKISFDLGINISSQMFKNIMSQNYDFFIDSNSSELTERLTTQNQRLIFHIIHPLLTIASNLLILTFTVGILIFLNWKISIISASIFFLIYVFIGLNSRVKLHQNSLIIKNQFNSIFKLMQESFSGMRDTILNKSQDIRVETFINNEKVLRNAEAINLFYGVSPRYIIEAIGICLILLFALYLKITTNSVANVIAITAVLAVAAQRLLPVIQTIYQSYVLITGANTTLNNVLETLNLESRLNLNKKNIKLIPLSLKKNIVLENVDFKYNSSGKTSLSQINLEIKSGLKIGIIGKTGSGKTTLLDILTGLLVPSNGSIKIDGEVLTKENQHLWQNRISYIPQNIFLSDTSIRENIAIENIKDIKDEKVILSAKISEIEEFINTLECDYKTVIGEKGVKISGGQRQRIGIARAIYSLKDLLIMDEATSALDTETENKIIENLNKLHPSLTIIMVAHRKSTLRNCDEIYELDNGKILKKMTYNELIKNN